MGEIRALLLTDVVDSTRLTQSLGDAAAARLWAAHDRIARDLLRDWGGREIDKSDGFLFLFPDAGRALGYAQAYHHAIAALEPPLRARAGIDAGPVILRENEAADVKLGAKPLEVEGIAKALAARVMSAASAGRTLLTANAARTVQGAAILRSQGHWRMKGMAEPVELFEAGEGSSRPIDSEKAYRVVLQDGLWLPESEVKHGLPAGRDAFVGREEELRRLARSFEEGARLVSILAMGGSGKTRLAMRYAWSSLGEFAGGAWFCDLSGARSLDGIVNAVAVALDVQVGRADGVERIGAAIAARGRCLVILDNFEQVARHAPGTLGAWMDRAPEACFLVTTRDVLGLRGENVLPLPPLPEADAAALFLERAAAAGRTIEAASDETPTVRSLVTLLDGLPLAIELAAARARIMSPGALLARMSERFQLLSSASERRDRHATLRSTFDWSWELLTDLDKSALAQLSVFDGGLTLEAAEAVLRHPSTRGRPWAMDAVQSLVDKSFLRPAPGERFEMLVSVREYAAEHLATPGRFEASGPEALDAARRRHLDHFAAFGEERAIAGRGADLDNLVAACRYAVRCKLPGAIGALEGAWGVIRLRGPYRIASELATAVREAVKDDSAELANVERILGSVLMNMGAMAQAATHLQAGRAAARVAGDARTEARIGILLGAIAETDARNQDALAHYGDVLAFALANADDTLEWQARQGQSNIAFVADRLDQVEVHCRAALAAARRAGDRRREGLSLTTLANACAELGRPDEALALFGQSLVAAAEIGDRKWESAALCNLSQLEQALGRNADAERHLLLALELAIEMGIPALESAILCNLGIARDALGQRAQARRHLEDGIAIARRLGDRRFEGLLTGHLASVDAHEGRHEEARRRLEIAESMLAEVNDRRSLAIVLCARAEAERLASRFAEGAAALASARAIAAELGVGEKSVLGMSLARVAAMPGPQEGAVRAVP